MGRIPAARLLALALALSATAARAQDARDGGLVIGAMRQDARAHAFARLSTGEWRVPGEGESLPERWWLTPFDAAARKEIRRTSAPRVLEDDCDQVGLFDTNGDAGYVQPDSCPVPKVGLIFSKPIKTYGLLTVATDTIAARRIAEHAAARIVEFERRLAKENGDRGLTPMGEGCRRKEQGAEDAAAWSCDEATTTVRTYVLDEPAPASRFFWVTYHTTGRRKALVQYDCGETLYTGWLRESNGKITALQDRVGLTGCESKDESEQPLLGFGYAGRIYFVSQIHGWESESHALSELTPTSVVRLVNLGNHSY